MEERSGAALSLDGVIGEVEGRKEERTGDGSSSSSNITSGRVGDGGEVNGKGSEPGGGGQLLVVLEVKVNGKGLELGGGGQTVVVLEVHAGAK
jgi:hypothetical protein